MATYLADTSAWANARRRSAPQALRDSFSKLLTMGEVATCGPVMWEMLHSTDNAAEYRARRESMEHLDQVPLTNIDWGRALDLGEALAGKGGSLHRAPSVPDVIVAVAAERAGLTVLHYDKDFDLIAGVTGQPCEWIAPKGSL